MREDHDGIRSDERAAVLQAIVDETVPRLQGVGEPEGQVSERDDDVRADLFARDIVRVPERRTQTPQHARDSTDKGKGMGKTKGRGMGQDMGKGVINDKGKYKGMGMGMDTGKGSGYGHRQGYSVRV